MACYRDYFHIKCHCILLLSQSNPDLHSAMDMLKLFHILHILVQICFGSKVGKKGRFTHLAETHAGDKFLVHMSKEKKKLPRHNLEKVNFLEDILGQNWHCPYVYANWAS